MDEYKKQKERTYEKTSGTDSLPCHFPKVLYRRHDSRRCERLILLTWENQAPTRWSLIFLCPAAPGKAVPALAKWLACGDNNDAK